MHYKNINESTLDFDSCIGCAICDTVCPHDAITMYKNTFLEIKPNINLDKCTNCTLCVHYCPLERNKLKSIANIIAQDNPHQFGLKESSYWLAWNQNDEERIHSASGGAVTAIIKQMFEAKMIDGVIHAKAIPGSLGELHYQSTISYSFEEAQNHQGSFYQALDYTQILSTLKNSPDNRYLLVAIPCIISGIKRLIKEHKEYKTIELFTVALACSHNVNPQFTSFMAESAKLNKKQPFIANMRAKDPLEPDANNFHTRFTTPSGKILFTQNRFASNFTNTWRNYLFAKSACLNCPDFWGYEADISVKDAWGKWSFDDVLGKSMVVVRNHILEDLFLTNQYLSRESLSLEEVQNSQVLATQFKHVEITNKLYKSIYSKENRQNGMLYFYVASKVSKVFYRLFGFFITLHTFKVFKKLIELFKNSKQKLSSIMFVVKKIFRFVPKYTLEKPYILVLGGYGYANVGDEAQLNVTLKELSGKFPQYQLIVLTPDIKYTQKEHDCIAELAPRVAFFDHDIDTYYWLQTREHKNKFLKNSIRIYFTAWCDQLNIPLSAIGEKKMSLLSMIKGSSMVYFSGGGYLTGKTLSRLWDGCLFILLAKLYKKPIVLSGQTIGLFRNKFDKFISKLAFVKTDLITVRDAEDSLKDLMSIGIHGKNVYATFDDALFCDKTPLIKLKEIFPQINFDKKYISLQFHYWGISDLETKQRLLENINQLVSYILYTTDFKIILFGMHMYDLEALDNYVAAYAHPRVIMLGDNRNFSDIRGIIANSEICITMKHHPIIFAIGERTPVISLAFDEYYVHKNKGALGIFGLEEFNIDISKSFDLDEIIKLATKALKDKKINEVLLGKKLQYLKDSRLKFLDNVNSVLGSNLNG